MTLEMNNRLKGWVEVVAQFEAETMKWSGRHGGRKVMRASHKKVPLFFDDQLLEVCLQDGFLKTDFQF